MFKPEILYELMCIEDEARSLRNRMTLRTTAVTPDDIKKLAGMLAYSLQVIRGGAHV